MDDGFTTSNTSGVNAAELVALNRLLDRVTGAGLDPYWAKIAIDAACRDWLEPADAAGADLERVLARR